MERRDFVKKFPFAVIGGLTAVQELLANPFSLTVPSSRAKETIAIIGAGAAGMYAAKLLNDAGADYRLFEASSVKGGRIRPLSSFADKPIELGAEFIHGSKSMLFDLAKKQKAIREQDPVKKKHVFFYYDGKIFHGRQILLQEGILTALRFKSKIEKYTGDDITIADYLKLNVKKFPKKIWPLVNAFISNTEGTSINRMGMYSFAKESNRWHSGDDDYNTFIPLLDILEKEVGPATSGNKIVYNSPIREIDYSGEKVVLLFNDGKKQEFDKVLVTVSLNVLRSGDIKFNPPLPAEKQAAMKKIGMDAGMKIFLKFKEPFFKGGPVSLITDGDIPLMWRSLPDVYTVFAMGEKAEYLSALGNKATDKIIDELNLVFNKIPGKVLTDVYIQDWYKEPYVKGAYSYAAPGTEGQRELLAKPLAGKLFFAGEATNFNGHNACVHGAMETGQRAVQEMLKA